MCPLQEFVPCDEGFRSFYRNKTEFSIGRSCFDEKIVVGFNCGDASSGASSVERGQSPEDIPTLSRAAFEIGIICENYIRDSEIEIYNKDVRQGFWRNITIRQSDRTNEILVNVIGRKRHFDETPEGGTPKTFDQEILKNFTDHFMAKYNGNEHLSKYNLTGLVFQNNEELSDVVPINPDCYEQLHGTQSFYNETILGVQFEVSPSSFLQVNIDMCEKLYKVIDSFCQMAIPKELAPINSVDSALNIAGGYILLDIFSGIGTIGLCLGKNAKKVIGIEINEKACQDALNNAKRNGITNYEVVVGKAEDKIGEVCKEYMSKGLPLIGVIDPPRAGIHPTVINALRCCKGLNEMVFVACDLNKSKENILKLCMPQSKKVKGPPFSPISCVGMDLFPHTPHYEAVLYMKRMYE